MGIFMNKFKVGDRVRVIASEDELKALFCQDIKHLGIYLITHTNIIGEAYLKCDPEDTCLHRNHWVKESMIELANVSTLKEDKPEERASLEKPSPPEQALRYNTGKPQLSYILDVMPALKDLTKRMEHGSQKYERSNWKKGFNKEELIDSTLRHLTDFHEGKDIDLESGEDKLSNIGGVLFNVTMLTYFYGSESEYWKEKYDE